MMRVLHVYSGNLFGGVERMLVSVAALEAHEFQHTFALCFEGRLSQALRRQGASLESLPPVRISQPLTVARARSTLRRILRAQAFDAVICHGIWSYCVFAPAIFATKQSPVLFLHDAPEPRNIYYRWAWLRPPKLCIANSAYVARLASGLRPQVHVEVIHPLVPEPQRPDPRFARRLRASLGADEQAVVILQASRLDPWKGQRNLLKALRTLRDVPGWVCWIAGAPQRPQEEEYKQELCDLVDAFELSRRVKFIGHRDDMETVLEACDIYCQANETPEPFGMVFVEALFTGKPVVASATGGTLDIVGPDCGVLCGPSEDALPIALRRLIQNKALRAEMSASGPARARALCGERHFTLRLKEVIRGWHDVP